MVKNKLWLLFALITTVSWGIWGALTEVTEKAGFPSTYIYIVWSISMIIPAVIGLKVINWKLDTGLKPVLYGLTVGLLGAGGQLVLFTGAIENGPAYLIFSIISLSPIVTIIMSLIFLKEKASKLGWIGIAVAIVAVPLLSYQPPEAASNGTLWLIFALLVLLAWGVQAYFMKSANEVMKAESIFFYMMLTGILLAPVAWFMTDTTELTHHSLGQISTAFIIQLLNSIGALTLVYAFRHGKAIVVSPLTNAVAPIITILLSLIIYAVMPHPIVIVGMVMAALAIFLLANE